MTDRSSQEKAGARSTQPEVEQTIVAIAEWIAELHPTIGPGLARRVLAREWAEAEWRAARAARIERHRSTGQSACVCTFGALVGDCPEHGYLVPA